VRRRALKAKTNRGIFVREKIRYTVFLPKTRPNDYNGIFQRIDELEWHISKFENWSGIFRIGMNWSGIYLINPTNIYSLHKAEVTCSFV
jgi:hypothetical protein